ncbi:hypothetical protein [Clostridium botulinum]|uniref:Uncharacterized protein n=1 Tax=Clostridium botulinum TaxID=1491 RepID=A0ABD7CEN9_CLOBO|nr:hypothetical protein [Clostridium botulinum]MCC5427690.1 hypothetical protein [Clostridium botulinum]QRI51828.1 hypothetical protein JQS73_10115 [Clostridium botulinum]
MGDASADFSWLLANDTGDYRSIAAKILNNDNDCFTGMVAISGGLP